MRTCCNCKQQKNESEFHPLFKGGRLRSYCKICDNTRVKDRQKANKLAAVQYKGGKCQRCGYDKYYGALDFHHIHPSTKDPSVSRMSNYPIGKLKKELDKCILVCANCHREIHGGL